MRLKESDIDRIVRQVVNEGIEPEIEESFWGDVGNTMKTGWNKLTGKPGSKGTFSKLVQIDCIKKTLDGAPGGPVMAKFCGGGAKPSSGGGMMGKAAEMAKKAAMASKTGGSGTKPTTTGGGTLPSNNPQKALGALSQKPITTGGTMNEIWRRVRY
jgi:hypothetical protein